MCLDLREPVNIGWDELISVGGLVSLIEKSRAWKASAPMTGANPRA